MSLLSITGYDLVRCIKAGCIRLEHNRDEVDQLNVFPVPDGDTGTNMYLTLLSAVREGEKNSTASLGKVAKAVSMGSLMGARGNSGVILSQIFRGFAKTLENKETANAVDLALALRSGADTAYKAVMKPVEGTILTVIREIARACEQEAQSGSDILAVLLIGVEEGYRTLEKTPSLLPILKEAGVVDAGGRGLLFFLEGVIEGLAADKEIQLDSYKEKTITSRQEMIKQDIVLDFQYCTEMLIKGQDLNPEDIKDHLRPLGDSMLVVGEEEIVKVHIHSNHPGKVLETALQFGQLSDIKINNMLEEVHENRHDFEPNNLSAFCKKIGLVAVAAGEGIVSILQSLGVDQVVQGGQSMNPSTEDLLKACQDVPAQAVIIMPNNKNIIMAAEQVKELSDKQVTVLPTRSVMQAIAALIAYDSEGELDVIMAAMQAETEKVSYAEVTHAVRDSGVSGLEIEAGNVIGLIDGKISQKADSEEEVVLAILRNMIKPDSELITFLYGNGLEEAEASALQEKVMEICPQCEVEMHFGGQPHYSYFISVE
ncbi:MAG TPA: DAK2 domain-containing protein [Syntrophomonas sp.]|nr:DAK2 domain-containing protein [Syntrophomonas sp.]HRW11975.1 DAK2 domain-containing protein [Syntrophomonas sp.]